MLNFFYTLGFNTGDAVYKRNKNAIILQTSYLRLAHQFYDFSTIAR